MPEQSGGERTLPATPRRLERAREEGNVARSTDLNAAVGLLAALAAVFQFGPGAWESMLEAMRYYLGSAADMRPTASSLASIAYSASYYVFIATAPIVLALMLVGTITNLSQVGFLTSFKAIAPRFDRINPITGFQKFFTLRALVELVKSLAKLGISAYIAYLILFDRWQELVLYMRLTPLGVTVALGKFAASVWFWIGLAMLALAILDLFFQRWQWAQDLMMTTQEYREELREMEGDPRIRQRVRSIQRQMAMQRMMKNVPTADVIITNPVRFAVALKYDAANMAAPIVVAKGARLLAERIRAIATENDVPIVERPELARTLYRSIDIDQPVPENLFRAVAEVLAFVYRIDRRVAKKRDRLSAQPSLRPAI
jgi:flagellar biosynthetic protein FlhB